MNRPPLPPSVKRLGWASFFTDAASEAIYPLLPIFVTRVLGGSAISLGVIEGAAEAMSSVLKIVAGRASDRTRRRKPFVLFGYGLASAVRPLIAFATAWPHVFAIRLTDRVGKGIRGAPRDALLGTLAPAGQRGRVFGFHRAMDHAGAVVGPLLAFAFLWWFPGEYRLLFGLTVIPGVLAVVMVATLAEPRDPPPPDDIAHAPPRPRAPPMPPALRRYLLVLGLFTLGNSADAFLLLRLSDAGLPAAMLPLVWSGLHVVKSGLSTWGGALSDRFGRRTLIVAGWGLYAVTYAGFAVSTSLVALLGWLAVYGVHFALAEGSEKALVADLAPDATRGTAFGWYNAVLGFGALGASLLFGVLYEWRGPVVAFGTGAALAVTAAALLAADRRLASPS